MVSIQFGYGPPVGQSAEGFPIYLYTDPNSRLTSYVVVLPDRRAFYSDQYGRIISKPTDTNPQVALALLGGIVGLAMGLGPVGAIVGGILGAAVGNEAAKKRAT